MAKSNSDFSYQLFLRTTLGPEMRDDVWEKVSEILTLPHPEREMELVKLFSQTALENRAQGDIENI